MHYIKDRNIEKRGTILKKKHREEMHFIKDRNIEMRFTILKIET